MSGRFIVDVGSPGGERRQIRRQGFPTSTAASAELHRVLDDASRGVIVTRDGITVRESSKETQCDISVNTAVV
jgi:hypothetical protein